MNNIERVNLIQQDIYTVQLENLDHDQIASDINLYSKTISQESPEYGWISRGFVQYEDLIVPITPEIAKLQDEVLKTMKKITGKDYSIEDIWAVELVKNQSVISHSHHSNLHAHPEEYYSIAYYPSAPVGSAELIFTSNWCNIMESTRSVNPKKGLLVIFNSYLKHMTARHKIDEKRLVISMNLGPITPNKEPNADWSVYWNRPTINNPKVVKEKNEHI